MTIAACYLSTEGVVLGADSTTTMFVSGPVPGQAGTEHHFNFAQKIFQVGHHGTLGMTMWGLGSLGNTSYRTLIAELGDSIQNDPPQTMEDVADRWNEHFWAAYSTTLPGVLQKTQQLEAEESRTPDEENELQFLLQAFSVGFCLAGNCLPDRTPNAYEFHFSPNMTSPSQPVALSAGSAKFWGCPNLIHRLIYGVDLQLMQEILDSDHWNGTLQDLVNLVQPHKLVQPLELPIREAVDWVHASIHATIKTMKFSHVAPVCGGPVEVAVITTDRLFRWVRHKRLSAAIGFEDFPDARSIEAR